MPGEKKEFSPLISTSAIALALAGVAYVLFQPPLESIRPGAASLKGLESRGDERVQARLWQDPFLAVADHQKREKEEGETEREDGLDLRFKLHEGHSIRIQGTTDRPDTHHSISNLTKYFEEGRKTLVMMVMTEGSSSAEGHEVRLRDRNAILSALGVACFVPTDEEHIRYFKWSPDGLTEKNETYLKYVPYEWFEHRKLRQCKNGEVDKYAGVLVLWFQEDDLRGHPLKTLSDVWEQVSEQINEKSKTRPIIIGPRTSTGLRDMVEGILTDSDFQREAGREGGKLSLFKGNPMINLWSPWATVDDDLLVYSFRDIIEKYKKRKRRKRRKV